MPKICQILNWAAQKLKKAGIESAGLDAEILLINILNHPGPMSLRSSDHPSLKRRGFLYTHPEFELTKAQEKKYKKFISRRAKGKPVAYILGQKEFFGLDFLINKNVLIPRPETELIVNEILKQVQNDKNKKNILIDIGTGSGCIPIVVAKSLITNHSSLIPKIIATDLSVKALAVAKKNARFHGLDKKIKFVKSNLLNFLLPSRAKPASTAKRGERWDLEIPSAPSGLRNDMKIIVTANLPYLPEKIYRRNYQGLKFEPRAALVAKNNGLALYEKLLKQIKQLTINSQQLTILLEILPLQKSALQKLIKKHLPKASVEFKKDLAGKWRMVVIKT